MTNLLVVDFETYYDRSYSLSKLTTEAYVRDRQFQVIGVSAKLNDEPAEWFSGTKQETKEWLDQWPWGSSIAVAHNAMFDMAILNWHFGIRPKRIADTLSMARALDGPDAGNSLAKLAERHGAGVKGDEVINALGKRRLGFDADSLARYGAYCRNDVELTYKLFHKLAAGFPLDELKLIDLTIRMFTEPVLELDREVLAVHLADVKEKKTRLLSRALISKDNLMSNPQLAETLRSLGVEPPMKISPTTGRETYAFSKTDEAFQALLGHEDLLVQAIISARLGVKSTLEETRTERFIDIASRGTLPIPLRYYAAHTGRWGGDDKVNLQNLPRTSKLKYAIKAPDGCYVLDVDSSQIECRVLAWMAGQEDLVAFFRKNNEEIAAGVPKHEMQYDPYRIMASQIYGVAVCDVDATQRHVGKVVLLGAGYGLGWRRFKDYAQMQGLTVDDDFAQRTIATYRSTFPMIPAVWEEGDATLAAMAEGCTASLGRSGVLTVVADGIRLPNSLHLRYPNLRRETDPKTGRARMAYDTMRGQAVMRKGIWGGALTENWSQALARIVIGAQMLMVARKYRAAMTVHDSVVAVVPEAEALDAREYVETCMRTRPAWASDLPLNCEAKIGVSYGG